MSALPLEPLETREERVRREARLRARFALSGHRGVLRSLSIAARQALFATDSTVTIGRPESSASED